ncbi:hypothetical protein [Chryseobacterium sp. G0201]|uniref:hypothetical protein n=1 Tax=Chryseobacterium sp. G0201 TaxID=2487065 RepID=UPI000F4F04E4|nr:hypothetical protein [Chryseobacterium sp. G0201]AZA53935.1 hypothetical protein EG348_13450 [Chryseobacterium sp. G0201]
MKKTLFAAILFATLGTTNISAKTLKAVEPEITQCYRETTCLITIKEGDCKITYQVTKTYYLCFLVCEKKTVVKKDCSGGGGNGRSTD